MTSDLIKPLEINSLIGKWDPEIAGFLNKELDRQEYNLELIASENYASPQVMLTMASVLTNKYAEGYPGKRYYGGCEFVDEAERLAIKRVKALFNSPHANVQPHSGSNANQAVYFAALNPGDTLLGMNLNHGGHLTHGSPVNFSGKLYKVIPYGVRSDTHLIDYDEIEDLAKTHQPKLILAGATAYPRIIDFEKLSEIAKRHGALLWVDMAHIAGLVAADCHPTPVGHAQFISSTTHKTLRGPRGGFVLTDHEDRAKAIRSAVFPGSQGGPLMHVIAAKAVAFHEALKPDFKDYQRQVIKNAQALAEILLEKGFQLISGGTDNHLILVDLTNRNITGKAAEKALDLAGITLNKNTIPNETRSPFVTSGIRIGVPAVTTRGMKENEMKMVGEFIALALEKHENPEGLSEIAGQIRELCRAFPIYR